MASLTENQSNSSTAGVATSGTSVQLAAANGSRSALKIFNASTNPLYVNFGAAAAISSGHYVHKVAAGALWEPAGPIYNGVVNGIWSADDSSYANITEISR